MIKFKYKNKEYTIFFYPCGFLARVEIKGKTREIKFNENTTIIHFLNVLEKIQF